MIFNPGKNNCHENRMERLCAIIKEKAFKSFIILKDENIFYLTGFYGKNSGSLLLITSGKIYLLVNFIYFEQAKRDVLPEKINIIEYSKNKYKKLIEILEGHDCNLIGIEGKSINSTDYLNLKNLLVKRGKKLKGTVGTVEGLRVIKDEIEISNIRKACKITDNVFTGIIESGLAFLDGETETTLALKIEKNLIKGGAEGRSFDMVIANNEGSSMPHYISSHKNIKDGLLLMDFGCRYNNYLSDITRTIFLKKFKSRDKFRKIYDIV